MSYFRLQEQSKIYVAAPWGVATGGPELLHQLVYHLRRDVGLDAYVYYYGPRAGGGPVARPYEEYANPYAESIEDKENNVLILPEVFPALSLMLRYGRIQKAIWWLSVDNCFLSYLLYQYRWNPIVLAKRAANKVFRVLVGRPLVDLRDSLLPENVLQLAPIARAVLDELGEPQVHLYQSWYARELLNQLNVAVAAYLPDFIHPDFLRAACRTEKRGEIVAYNPAKGLSFTKKVIRAAARLRLGVSFEPVSGLGRAEVIELLGRAKVYIDFGYHPGKDRLPREAAALGCCVLVGLRGSAANEVDVPIPREFKFSAEDGSIPAIVSTIEWCVTDYERVRHRFEDYRRRIAQERGIFLERLREVFVRDGKAELDGANGREKTLGRSVGVPGQDLKEAEEAER